MSLFTLERGNVALLIIDVQEKLFQKVENPCEVLAAMQKVVQGFRVMQLPIVVTEQAPESLGKTVAPLRVLLDSDQSYLQKTCFSCLRDATIRKQLLDFPIEQWVLIGLEAHICVMQSAKELIMAGKKVTVLNDAITSRSIYDFSTAIAEMRDFGTRISSVESVLFELLGDADQEILKSISQLVKCC